MGNGEYIDIGDLIEDRRTIPVIFDNGNRISVTYRPALLTMATLDEAAETEEDVPLSESVLKDFCDQVVSWDLSRGGNPIPITAEALRTVPSVILGRVQRAISDDLSKLSGATRPSVTSRRKAS